MSSTTKIHKSFEWDMGHRISQHGGKCFSPHGHRYKATVWLEGIPNDKGMVMDFYQLSQIVDPIVNELDHAFMVYDADHIMIEFFTQITDASKKLDKLHKDADQIGEPCTKIFGDLGITRTYHLPCPFKFKVVPFESTAENIAKYIFDRVYEKTPNVIKVEVWETPKCCATYEVNIA